MPSPRLEQLKELTWLDQNFNMIIMGPNGIGKSFLAAGLCHHAISSGYRAYFRPMDQIMTMLKTRDMSRSAQVDYRHLSTAHLVVIDDIMTINMARNEANVFFHFINALHEKVSFVITTNKSPKEWVETIGDEVITTAILDRLLYHCEIIKLTGQSFRLKNRENNLRKTSLKPCIFIPHHASFIRNIAHSYLPKCCVLLITENWALLFTDYICGFTEALCS